MDTLALTGSGVLSSCATSYILVYAWSVTDSTGRVVSSKTASANPANYLAAAYAFTAGSAYNIGLSVTAIGKGIQRNSTGYANAEMYVQHGNVVVSVRGGYFRQVRMHLLLIELVPLLVLINFVDDHCHPMH